MVSTTQPYPGSPRWPLTGPPSPDSWRSLRRADQPPPTPPPGTRPLVSERGAPIYLRSDNGPEFVSRALLKWIVDQGIETALIDPGKPWQNGTTESFNGKFRDECLSLEWFRSRAEAKIVIEAWRKHYNEVRPHSSLGYLTPAEFVARLKQNDAALVPATGRAAAVDGASAPRPVASPSRKGYSKAQQRPEISN